MGAQEPQFIYTVSFWKLLFFCTCFSLTLCLHSDDSKVLKSQRAHKDVFRINEKKGNFRRQNSALCQVWEEEDERAGGYQFLKGRKMGWVYRCWLEPKTGKWQHGELAPGWEAYHREDPSPTPEFCNKGCRLVWAENVGSGLWGPGFEFCIYHYQLSLGQIISLLWVSIFLRYKMRIIIVLLKRGMKIQWDGACFVCYQVWDCAFTLIIIKFRQYYKSVKELIPVILKSRQWMNMRNGAWGARKVTSNWQDPTQAEQNELYPLPAP